MMKMPKLLVMCAVTLVLAVLLSGCMEMNTDIIWEEDNTRYVTVEVGFANDFLEMAGTTAEEAQEGIRQDMEEDNDIFTYENYSNSEYTGVIATARIDDLYEDAGGSLGDLKFNYYENDGKKIYTVSGDAERPDPSEYDSDFTDIDGGAGIINARLAITMPGQIVSHNATSQEGNKLIWDLADPTATSIQATSEISAAWAPENRTPDITVLVNGAAVSFDQPPFIENGRTLVPLRAIFEALGAEVSWEETTQTVSAVRDDVTITLRIGGNILIRNGESIQLEVPAQITGGRTMVPVRAIAESFGAVVGWEPDTRTVTIDG